MVPPEVLYRQRPTLNEKFPGLILIFVFYAFEISFYNLTLDLPSTGLPGKGSECCECIIRWSVHGESVRGGVSHGNTILFAVDS